MWSWDPLWLETCLVDVYCHPHFWEEAGKLLERLPLPEAERYVAYGDTGCEAKQGVLAAAGFGLTGVHEKRVAADRERTRFLDVAVWERS